MSYKTFQCYVTCKGMEAGYWVETYTKDIDCTIEECGARLVSDFNKDRRPHEKERILLSVRRLKLVRWVEHDWEKTNLMTLKRGNSYIDTYACRRCKITGVRHGFGGRITIDKKFSKGLNIACCDLWATARPINRRK